MKTIKKYTLTGDKTTLSIPLGAKFLTVQMIIDFICLFAEIDTESEQEESTFLVYLDGKEILEDMGVENKYIGSTKFSDNNRVYHVYRL